MRFGKINNNLKKNQQSTRMTNAEIIIFIQIKIEFLYESSKPHGKNPQFDFKRYFIYLVE